MPKIKTRKTAAKRFKKTNPRGGKNPKVLYNKSGGHLFTKKSSREKSRKLPSHTVSDADLERILKLIGE